MCPKEGATDREGVTEHHENTPGESTWSSISAEGEGSSLGKASWRRWHLNNGYAGGRGGREDIPGRGSYMSKASQTFH